MKKKFNSKNSKIMLKGGLSNSIAKITECEESFITNKMRKSCKTKKCREILKKKLKTTLKNKK